MTYIKAISLNRLIALFLCPNTERGLNLCNFKQPNRKTNVQIKQLQSKKKTLLTNMRKSETIKAVNSVRNKYGNIPYCD